MDIVYKIIGPRSLRQVFLFNNQPLSKAPTEANDYTLRLLTNSNDVAYEGTLSVYYEDENHTRISGTPINAGKYYMIIETEDVGNFKGYVSDPVEINIVKKEIFVGNGTLITKDYDNSGMQFDLAHLYEVEYTDGFVSSYTTDTEGHENDKFMTGGMYQVKVNSKYSFEGTFNLTETLPGLYKEATSYDLTEGTYKVYYDGVDVTDSVRIVLQMNVMIKKADITSDVIITGYDGLYDGTYHFVDISILKASDIDPTKPAEHRISYSMDGINYQFANYKFIDEGTYKVYYLIEFDNYETIRGYEFIKISKANVTDLSVSDISMPYSGFEVSDPVITSSSDGQVIVKYYDESKNLLESKPINVGKYYVSVEILEGTSHNHFEEEFFSFEITKKEISLHWLANEVFYSQDVIYPKAQITIVTYDTLTLTYEADPNAIEVGQYQVKASIDNPNYKIINDTFTYDIVRCKVSIPEDRTYEFNAQVFATNNNPYLTVDISEVFNAGTYNVTYSLINDNYVFEDDTTQPITTKVTVTPKPLNLSDFNIARIEDMKFTGAEVTPDVDLTLRGIKLILDTDYELTYVNNILPYDGTNLSIITIKGINNYKDEITHTFRIIHPALSLVEGSKAKFVEMTSPTAPKTISHTLPTSKRVVLTNIHSETKVSDLINLFDESQRNNIYIYNSSNRVINKNKYATTLVTTGFKIILKDARAYNIDTVYVAIKGDLNSDGYIDASDLSTLQRSMSSLKNEYFVAADINEDGYIDASDRLLINRKIRQISDFESEY
jgi:hypothetical protein